MTAAPARAPRAPAGRGSGTVLRGDRGAVTVEAALALSTLMLVVALAMAAITAAATSVRCTDAARELVRLAARGEADRGRAVAARLAPDGARIELAVRGDEAVGEVTAAPLRLLPVRLTGRAVAVLEPGAVLEQPVGTSGAAPPAGGSWARPPEAVSEPDAVPGGAGPGGGP